MTFGLTPVELQTIALQLKEELLPLMVSASQSDRGNIKMLTVDEVATNARVVRKTVENWIASGRLRAVADWGTDKRPLYRVSVVAYWEFYDANPVIIRKARAKSGLSRKLKLVKC